MVQRDSSSTVKSPLNGLVLAGGYSTRMGQDKGMMMWHGKEQRYHLADLLGNYCTQVFISCRAAQEEEIFNSYQALPDVFVDLGPFGALLSAFSKIPDETWLILACDMPLVDVSILNHLLENRNSNAIATAFISAEDNLPEPMISIWEPASLLILQQELKAGNTSLRKVLQDKAAHLLHSPNRDVFMNVNTLLEAEQMREKIRLGDCDPPPLC
jgi:molybdopterin-guanine dinucleotide biosynthesis protein A